VNPSTKFWPSPSYWNTDRLTTFWAVEIERCTRRYPHALEQHEIASIVFYALHPALVDGLAYRERRDAAARFGAIFATEPCFVSLVVIEVRRRMARGTKRTWIRFWLDERLQAFESSASDAELAAAMLEETNIAVNAEEIAEHRTAMR
jgi:hypothetical protein